MVKYISTLEIRHHLGELLNRVHLCDDRYVIERKGEPLAAVVPIWQFEKWQEQRGLLFRKIEKVRARNKSVSLETIEAEVNEAILANRQRGSSGKGSH